MFYLFGVGLTLASLQCYLGLKGVTTSFSEVCFDGFCFVYLRNIIGDDFDMLTSGKSVLKA